ncbi:MAG: lysoplasmalogenase family protein [Acholeplasmataceae bacterium]
MLKRQLMTIIFLCIELTLWILILFVNPFLPSGTLHYLSIIICAIYVLLNYKGTKDMKIVLCAFSATLVADYFLTLQQTHQILGTFFFLIAQLFYLIRLKNIYPKSYVFYVPYVILMLLISASMWVETKTLDLLLIISIAYISILVINMVYALKIHKQLLIFGIGLLFEIGADIFVALGASAPYISFNPNGLLYLLSEIPFNMVWLFYIPAQVLFALSIKYHHIKQGESHV